MRTTLAARLLAALAVLALLTAGTAACGDDDDGTATGDTTTTEPATTEPPTTEPTDGPGPSATDAPLATEAPATTPSTSDHGDGIDPMDDADTAEKSAPAPDGIALLTDVRSGRHEGYDRVTFEFRDTVPGYTVGYQDRPILSDGEGAEVEIDGDAVLVARFEPASGVDLSGATYEEVYTGPTRIEGEGATIVEIVRTGDFEAVLTWALGVETELDFRVTTLDDPPRVVIDVRNH